jgi:predicted aspartyl protease
MSASPEIAFEYREGLLWIKANTPGSNESLNLLLDTGAGVSVLNASTAERLRLKLGSPVNVRGVDTTFTGHRLKGVSIAADGVQLPEPSLAVDLQKLSSSCAQPVDGLLGVDFIRGRAVQIDFAANKIRILSPARSFKSEDVLALQLRPCGMRVPIAVNGRKPQWVRLDTGCASPLQWVTSNVRAKDCMRKTAIGLTALSIPQTETTVQIGSQTFEEVPTGLHDKPIFQGEAGLLGNGLLSRFSSIIIDAKSGHLILQSRQAAP